MRFYTSIPDSIELLFQNPSNITATLNGSLSMEVNPFDPLPDGSVPYLVKGFPNDLPNGTHKLAVYSDNRCCYELALRIECPPVGVVGQHHVTEAQSPQPICCPELTEIL